MDAVKEKQNHHKMSHIVRINSNHAKIRKPLVYSCFMWNHHCTSCQKYFRSCKFHPCQIAIKSFIMDMIKSIRQIKRQLYQLNQLPNITENCYSNCSYILRTAINLLEHIKHAKNLACSISFYVKFRRNKHNMLYMPPVRS